MFLPRVVYWLRTGRLLVNPYPVFYFLPSLGLALGVKPSNIPLLQH